MEAPPIPSDEPQDGSQARLIVTDSLQIEPLASGTIYKCAIGVHVDDLLARNVVQITPHFVDLTGASSPATICTQIANNMSAYMRAPSVAGYVKLYIEDFSPGQPHPPVASATWGNVGGFLPAKGPGEIGLCLSYYASQNTKRWRGRLYLQYGWLAQHQVTPPGNPGVRPVASDLVAAMDFATVVLKPSNANGWRWCVASTVDKTYRQVLNYWCNDEWDIIRSRGLRETTRQTATFP
jgi:hypothetical protein